MNLISDIAEMASKGFTAAKMAVEIDVKHGVQVSEAWLEHIMGADGFHAALAQARAKLASLTVSVEEKLASVLEEPAKLVEEVIAKEDAVIAKSSAPGASLADGGVPSAGQEPAPAAPETKAADEPKSE